MIKSNDHKQCGCVGKCECDSLSELFALYELVDKFSGDMKSKLRKKFHEGYRGWDNREIKQDLINKLHKKLEEDVGPERFIDIANLAAFLWNLEAE